MTWTCPSFSKNMIIVGQNLKGGQIFFGQQIAKYHHRYCILMRSLNKSVLWWPWVKKKGVVCIYKYIRCNEVTLAVIFKRKDWMYVVSSSVRWTPSKTPPCLSPGWTPLVNQFFNVYRVTFWDKMWLFFQFIMKLIVNVI